MISRCILKRNPGTRHVRIEQRWKKNGSRRGTAAEDSLSPGSLGFVTGRRKRQRAGTQAVPLPYAFIIHLDTLFSELITDTASDLSDFSDTTSYRNNINHVGSCISSLVVGRAVGQKAKMCLCFVVFSDSQRNILISDSITGTTSDLSEFSDTICYSNSYARYIVLPWKLDLVTGRRKRHTWSGRKRRRASIGTL